MVKTITGMIKKIGKKAHKNINELAEAVLLECENEDIKVTTKGTIITKKIIINAIRGVLSNIRKGKAGLNKWTFRVGENYIRLYDSSSYDMKELNILESSLYQEVPVIKVLVDPKIDGVDMEKHYVSFEHLKDAKIFTDENTSAIDIFVFIDKVKIPLFYK